jgi:A/G-specific adenine glycosylase
VNLKNIPSFHSKLLAWYKKSARDLPWRRTKDPYKIWVSEIMLQQTQVDTVIPYYQKWLRRFPTIQSLAKASQSEVLKYWAGLGYYRRARFLHQAAQQLAKGTSYLSKVFLNPLTLTLSPMGRGKGEGRRSQVTVDDLMKLPGIGRYTAGAIASIAFGQKAPVLDGNIIRVFTRLFAIRKDVRRPKTIQYLWQLAESLISSLTLPLSPKGRGKGEGASPGDFNQALMELGAMICIPENPRCGICPVSKFCKAYEKKCPEKFPVKGRREKIEKRRTFALILRNNGKVLIQKQPEHARWGGLWTFPFENNKQSLAQRFKLKLRQLRPRLTLKHGFTRYQIRLDVYETFNEIASSASRPPHNDVIAIRHDSWRRSNLKSRLKSKYELRWIRISDLSRFPFPSPHQKIAKVLTENGSSSI